MSAQIPFISIKNIPSFLLSLQGLVARRQMSPGDFRRVLLSATDVLLDQLRIPFFQRPFVGAHNSYVTGPMPNHNIPFENQLNPNIELALGSSDSPFFASHRAQFLGGVADFPFFGFINGFGNLGNFQQFLNTIAQRRMKPLGTFYNITVPHPYELISLQYNGGDLDTLGSMLNHTLGSYSQQHNNAFAPLGLFFSNMDVDTFAQFKLYAPTNIARSLGKEIFPDIRTAQSVTISVCKAFADVRKSGVVSQLYENWWEGKWSSAELHQAAVCGANFANLDFQHDLDQGSLEFSKGALTYIKNNFCGPSNKTDPCVALDALYNSTHSLSQNYSAPHNMEDWKVSYMFTNPKSFYGYPLRNLGNDALDNSRETYAESYTSQALIASAATFMVVNRLLTLISNKLDEKADKDVGNKKRRTLYQALSVFTQVINGLWNTWNYVNLWAGLSFNNTGLGFLVVVPILTSFLDLYADPNSLMTKSARLFSACWKQKKCLPDGSPITASSLQHNGQINRANSLRLLSELSKNLTYPLLAICFAATGPLSSEKNAAQNSGIVAGTAIVINGLFLLLVLRKSYKDGKVSFSCDPKLSRTKFYGDSPRESNASGAVEVATNPNTPLLDGGLD